MECKKAKKIKEEKEVLDEIFSSPEEENKDNGNYLEEILNGN